MRGGDAFQAHVVEETGRLHLGALSMHVDEHMPLYWMNVSGDLLPGTHVYNVSRCGNYPLSVSLR